MLIELDVNLKPARASVINGHEIEAIDIEDCAIDSASILEDLFKIETECDATAGLKSDDIDLKRSKTIELLKKNRVPVDEAQSTSEVISIMDTVFIRSPFNVENCESTNEIVLNKITSLLKTL